MKTPDYESHPAAKLFPLMDGQDLADFIEDIKKNGLLSPIVIHEGMILDGRNRALACSRAGIEPRYVQWEHFGDISPTEWVLSINLQRRQLTTSQRVAVGVRALPMLEAEAKARQTKGINQHSSPVEKIPQGSEGKSRDKAATLSGVNPRYISDGKKILAEAPEKFAQIESGEKTISEVRKEMRGPLVPEPTKDPSDIYEETGAERIKIYDAEDLRKLKAAWNKATKESRKSFLEWIKK